MSHRPSPRQLFRPGMQPPPLSYPWLGDASVPQPGAGLLLRQRSPGLAISELIRGFRAFVWSCLTFHFRSHGDVSLIVVHHPLIHQVPVGELRPRVVRFALMEVGQFASFGRNSVAKTVFPAPFGPAMISIRFDAVIPLPPPPTPWERPRMSSTRGSW